MSIEIESQQAIEFVRREFARGIRGLRLRTDLAAAVVAALRADGATITQDAPYDGHVGLSAAYPGDAERNAREMAECEAAIAARRPRG